MSAGHVVLAAYRDTGAWDVPCPHCEADPGAPCTKADGRVSRVPCVGRLATADLAPTTVDFSEPRHTPREAS
ncbi:hypothetical protein MMIN_14270 [Mycolicibacter minnesotensis]|nr:hypothetical protein MMIN_14270 [Mycolicibacter minnesotensis]